MPLFSDVPCLSPTCGSRKQDPEINVVEAILCPGLILPQCGVWLQMEDPLFKSAPSLSNPGLLSVVWHERYMPFFSVRGRKGREDPQETNNTEGGFPHTCVSPTSVKSARFVLQSLAQTMAAPWGLGWGRAADRWDTGQQQGLAI